MLTFSCTRSDNQAPSRRTVSVASFKVKQGHRDCQISARRADRQHGLREGRSSGLYEKKPSAPAAPCDNAHPDRYSAPGSVRIGGDSEFKQDCCSQGGQHPLNFRIARLCSLFGAGLARYKFLIVNSADRFRARSAIASSSCAKCFASITICPT